MAGEELETQESQTVQSRIRHIKKCCLIVEVRKGLMIFKQNSGIIKFSLCTNYTDNILYNL